jgi:hypothetical protein
MYKRERQDLYCGEGLTKSKGMTGHVKYVTVRRKNWSVSYQIQTG